MKDQKLLLGKIKNKQVKIGVIGLGYVGLPLAILLAKNNFHVVGFVRSENKKNQLNKGQSYVSEEGINENLKKVIDSGNFSAHLVADTDLQSCDIYIVCVPTPVNEEKMPDLSDLKQVAKRLSEINLAGKLIVNESTVAPFTTRDMFDSIGKDYFLVCSPERIDPGNTTKTTENIAKVIGGIDEESLELGIALYNQVLKEPVIKVQSLEAAEMAKMLENTYRSVNIALINEFARLAEKCGIDILDVIQAAKTKWSYHSHYPGIGVGGHCIPVDPYYILKLAKNKGVDMSVIKKSLKENEQMPHHVAKSVLEHYKHGMKVLVYGITYKKNVADLRESPVEVFCDILQKNQVDFTVYDPLVNEDQIQKLGFRPGKLEKVDMFIVGTDHASLQQDYLKSIGENTLVIDGRNFFKQKVGKKVLGVGRILE